MPKLSSTKCLHCNSLIPNLEGKPYHNARATYQQGPLPEIQIPEKYWIFLNSEYRIAYYREENTTGKQQETKQDYFVP